jgi:hypothetical protein
MKTTTRARRYKYPYATKGEILYSRVRQWLFSSVADDHMDKWLFKIEHYSEELQEFIEQALSIWLTGRLIASGRSLHDEQGDRYTDDLRSALADYLILRGQDLDDIERMVSECVESSLREMSRGLRNQVHKFAISQHPYCYICGTALDFTGDCEYTAFTREHIWPQSLGGDSAIENLLPSCAKCNSRRKSNYATWAATSIQCIAVRRLPNEEDWKNIDGTHYYAMHQFAAQTYAIEHQVTLKQALLSIGPWSRPPTFVDESDIGHFFNLSII